MIDFFRIDTEQTHLSWSLAVPARDAETALPKGRLALIPHNAQSIRIWRLGVPPEVSADLAIKAGPPLSEQTSYNFLLRGAKGRVAVIHRDPVILNGLSHSPDGDILHGTINFKDQIGRSRFSVYSEGRLEYEFEVEVFPSKFEYVSDYNSIIADVQDIEAALALEYLRPTFKFGVTTPSDAVTRLEWMTSLNHVADNLERALLYIERHPHHGLARERVSTKVEKLRRPDATILKLVQQGKGVGPTAKTSSGLELHSSLPERRARLTLDTPEHRWLAAQLQLIRQTLAELRLAESKRARGNWEVKARQLRALEEIATLENRIAMLLKLAPVAHAKGLPPAGFSSLTLQTLHGYREACEACQILLRGLRVDGGPVKLAVKDIHLLYEYWCFLALVRLISRILGEPLPAQDLFATRKDGLQVQLQRGKTQTVRFANRTIELTYNPRFTTGSLFQQHPDIVLAFHSPQWPAAHLVFDVKYRIDSSATSVARFGSPGPPQDAINVLHRYRDAILQQTGKHGPRSITHKRTVVEGVALFPYADAGNVFGNSRWWSDLDKTGIGALPFLPSQTQYVEEWLRAVLSRGGWAIAERAIPHVSQELLHTWLQAEQEAVLVAVLRKNAREHFEWIKRERCYYTPETKTQRRQFETRALAFYSPASIRSIGAVTHQAIVETTEVLRRDEIRTPWNSRRPAEERQLVYRLGEVTELGQPIENRSASGVVSRFSRNRWTSQLGLLRAKELQQLFLETSQEWRLYEQLQAAGVDFKLQPGPANLQNERDVRGRTWFIIKHFRVRYQGEAGFLVRSGAMRDEFYGNLDQVVKRVAAKNHES